MHRPFNYGGQAVLEGVADGVMVADAEGRVILFNAAAERVLDLPRERALGQMTREMLGLYGGQADWVKTVARWAENPEAYATEEYLAAQLLARQWPQLVAQTPDFLTNLVADEWWREALLLTVGMFTCLGKYFERVGW